MTAVSTAGPAPRPRSRLHARLVLAGLSACGLAALAWASFVHPLPRLIYNPSDSVAVGWYRVDPLGHGTARSDERRAGKECVSLCSARWAPHPKKKNKE